MTAGTLLLIVAAIVLALAGARYTFVSRGLPGWLQPLLGTGVLFVFLGLLTGPQGANLFTETIIAQLNPVLVIALGWIGFLYGSHLEWRLLKRYPINLYLGGFFESLVTFGLVAGGSWWALQTWGADLGSATERLLGALILGICAAGTAPAGLFLLTFGRKMEARHLNTLRFFSAVDDLPALFVLALMDAFFRPDSHISRLMAPSEAPGGSPQGEGLFGVIESVTMMEGAFWLFITLGLGAGLGVITHWLFHRGDEQRQNSLILLGVVSLGAGAASLLHLSPLVVMALAGSTFANLSHSKESAYGLLVEREQSLYAVFLMISGMVIYFDIRSLLLVVPILVGLRTVGKLLGCYVVARWFLPGLSLSPFLGAGMLFQGGLALALSVSFYRSQEVPWASTLFTGILLSVVLNELLAPWLTATVISRKNEGVRDGKRGGP